MGWFSLLSALCIVAILVGLTPVQGRRFSIVLNTSTSSTFYYYSYPPPYGVGTGVYSSDQNYTNSTYLPPSIFASYVQIYVWGNYVQAQYPGFTPNTTIVNFTIAFSNGTRNVGAFASSSIYFTPGRVANPTFSVMGNIDMFKHYRAQDVVAFIMNKSISLNFTHDARNLSAMTTYIIIGTYTAVNDRVFLSASYPSSTLLSVSSCQSYCSSFSADLAQIETKQDYDEAIAAMTTYSATDAWTGYINWGYINNTAGSDLICRGYLPTFTFTGCRAHDGSAVYNGTCLQSFCGPFSLTATQPRNTGATCLSLKLAGGTFVDNQCATSATKSSCLCSRNQKILPGTPAAALGQYQGYGPFVYFVWSGSGAYNLPSKITSTLEKRPTRTPTPTASQSISSSLSTTESRLSSSSSYTTSATLSISVTATATRSMTPTFSVTESSTFSRTRTEPDTITVVLSDTPTGSMLSDTLSWTETGFSPSRSDTETLAIPFVELMSPTSRTLSEKEIYSGRWEAPLTIALRVYNAEWNCALILANPVGLFSSDLATNKAPKGFITRAANWFATSGAVSCNDHDLTFRIPRDREFSIDDTENVTLSIQPPTTGGNSSQRTGTGFQPTDAFLPTTRANLNGFRRLKEKVHFVNDRFPPVVSISPAVTAGAQSTASASSAVAAAAGNPAVAVQGARTALIFAILSCEDSTGDGMDWMSHPTQQEVGMGPTASWAGAALWNPIIIAGACFLHFVAAWTFAAMKPSPLRRGMSKVWFPALQALLILPLLQPTVQAVVTVFRQSNQFNQILVAIFGTLSIVGFFVYLARITLPVGGFFGAEYVPCPTTGPHKRHWFRKFLAGPGEYEDSTGREGFVRMHFMYFDLYQSRRVWYVMIEMGATVLFGVLSGWRPSSDSGCTVLTFILAALFVILLLIILLLRPYVSWMETLFAVFVAGIQSVGAMSVAIYAILRTSIPADMGTYTATVGLYVLTTKAILDVVLFFYDIIVDCCCKKPEPHEGKVTEEGPDVELEGPLLAKEFDDVTTAQESPSAFGGRLARSGTVPGKEPPPIPRNADLLRMLALRNMASNPLATLSTASSGSIPPPPPGPPPASLLSGFKAPPPVPTRIVKPSMPTLVTPGGYPSGMGSPGFKAPPPVPQRIVHVRAWAPPPPAPLSQQDKPDSTTAGLAPVGEVSPGTLVTGQSNQGQTEISHPDDL